MFKEAVFIKRRLFIEQVSSYIYADFDTSEIYNLRWTPLLNTVNWFCSILRTYQLIFFNCSFMTLIKPNRRYNTVDLSLVRLTRAINFLLWVPTPTTQIRILELFISRVLKDA